MKWNRYSALSLICSQKGLNLSHWAKNKKNIEKLQQSRRKRFCKVILEGWKKSSGVFSSRSSCFLLSIMSVCTHHNFPFCFQQWCQIKFHVSNPKSLGTKSQILTVKFQSQVWKTPQITLVNPAKKWWIDCDAVSPKPEISVKSRSCQFISLLPTLTRVEKLYRKPPRAEWVEVISMNYIW